ncbi:MAG: hypothetical protein HC923_07650, partial [Myxococcales bacterium]|nr:hypothetical protein [Myxococcales bacterium]
LFDEPLSNLDAKLRVQMRAEIARLHQRLGTTTVYVTHDQVEAMTLAKHIVVMNKGVIQQVGAPLELYNHPTNTFVAGFIGSPAMNFFDASAVEENGALVARGNGFAIPIPEAFKPGSPESETSCSGSVPSTSSRATAGLPTSRAASRSSSRWAPRSTRWGM